jgi:predicted 3-demethylubiquinone-9 3-methyltransferase (glyoxalase superfamily)
MQKITPFLWFDNQAEEAVKFYAAMETKGRTPPEDRRAR